MSDDLPAAALAYARAGLRVLPLYAISPHGGCQCRRGASCPDAGKHPRITEWQHQASSDEAQIRTWWRGWPDANIGVACGAEVVVIDVDVKAGAPGESSLATLAAELGDLPDSAEALTPTGGRHLVFRGDPTLRNSQAGKLAAGLDVRGNGGYFVAPPSRTEKGEYEWRAFSSVLDGPLVPLPRAWLERLAAGRNGNGNGRHHAGSASVGELPAEIYEGQGRNAQLFSLACGMVARGMSRVEIKDSLDSVNYHRCRPPLDTDELGKLIDSALKYPRGEAKPAKAPPRDQPPPAATNGTATGPEIFSAHDLASMTFAARRWAVPSLLSEGLTVIGGRVKMGKSWLMLGVSVAVACGGVALGNMPAECGDVLYLALEDNKLRLQDRLRTILQGAPFPPRLHFALQWPKLGQGCLKQIKEWLDAHPDARLVVIDVLARVQPGRGEKAGPSYNLDYGEIGGLQKLAGSYHVCIVVLTHLNQRDDAEDYLDLISGTTGIIGPADGAMILKRQRGHADAFLLGTHRDLKDEVDLALRWNRDIATWTIAGAGEEYRQSKERGDIYRAIREAGGPLSPTEVADILGISIGNAKMTLTRMAQDLTLVSRAGRYDIPGR